MEPEMFRPAVSHCALIIATVALMGAWPALADALLPAALRQAPSAAQENPGDPQQTNSSITASPDINDQDSVEPVHIGDVTYVTGGIGDDERAALLAMKPHYNLRVLNTVKGGGYVGATHITLRRSQGAALLDLSAGPIFLAQLPPGRYMLTASNEGHNRQEKINLKDNKPAALNFSWD